MRNMCVQNKLEDVFVIRKIYVQNKRKAAS